MTPERFQRMHDTLDQRQPDMLLLTEQVNKSRNLAAIIRTCDAVGIQDVHITKPRDGYNKFRGTAMGSQQWVDVHLHEDIEVAVERVRAAGTTIYAAHISDTAINYREVDYTQPFTLLMGEEKAGISSRAEVLADHHITIPMMGMVQSYNVSVAAAIILAEAQEQRQRAGLYDKRRLDSDKCERLFFEWAHPKITIFCKDKGIAYPEIRADGEIMNPAQWYQSVK